MSLTRLLAKNKIHIEEELQARLKKICKSLGFHLTEWDMDAKLHHAIKTAPEWVKKTYADRQLYDQMMSTAELLSVKIEPKYYWFYKL